MPEWKLLPPLGRLPVVKCTTFTIVTENGGDRFVIMNCKWFCCFFYVFTIRKIKTNAQKVIGLIRLLLQIFHEKFHIFLKKII